MIEDRMILFPWGPSFVEVSVRTADPGMGACIACARESLTWFARAGREARQAERYYELACLLCQDGAAGILRLVDQDGAISLLDNLVVDRTRLLGMQAHLDREHGIGRQDMETAVRLERPGERTRSLWALSPERAGELGLSQLCFLEAFRHAAPQQEGDRGTIPVLLRGADSRPVELQVWVAHSDEVAWYGTLSPQLGTTQRLVFPRGEWERGIGPGQ